MRTATTSTIKYTAKNLGMTGAPAAGTGDGVGGERQLKARRVKIIRPSVSKNEF